MKSYGVVVIGSLLFATVILSYGDLSTFGHPTIRTPNLDRLAAEGQKWTNFYSAASVCTPSRAALLTGRLPVRNGMMSPERRVLFPDSPGGLPSSEITLAETLKEKGYATACVGKWHLGHLPAYLPTSNGFDSYFGLPYSNDMNLMKEGPKKEILMNPKAEYWNVPLLRIERIVERPADQTTITKRYTEEAIEFIHRNKEKPFFLYLAHTMPHVPLFASEDFLRSSKRGLYGDVIEEIDAIQLCKDLGVRKTQTSDTNGGSAGPPIRHGLREPTMVFGEDQLAARSDEEF